MCLLMVYNVGFQIGSGLSQGTSMTLGFSTGLFERFRNPRDQRDFVTAGDFCHLCLRMWESHSLQMYTKAL